MFYSFVSFSQNNCDSLLLQSITNPGPYSIDQIDENDGLRNGPQYSGATIFYPQGNMNNLAAIIFVPGYSNTQLTIQNWGYFLASHGIVTMTIGTNSLLDSHIGRRDALLDAITTLKEENSRLNSPLYNSLDTSRLALGGFSKGAGGAQLAASVNHDLKAIVALYPWLENITPADLSHNTPVIIVSGSLDLIAPPSLHADVHYSYTPDSTDKLKYEVAFATHDPLIGPNAGGGDVGVKVLSWLKTYLEEDSCYCPLLLDIPSTATSYLTNIDCSFTTNNDFFLAPKREKKVVKIVNIFGQEVDPSANNILFYIYDDKTVQKRINLN